MHTVRLEAEFRHSFSVCRSFPHSGKSYEEHKRQVLYMIHCHHVFEVSFTYQVLHSSWYMPLWAISWSPSMHETVCRVTREREVCEREGE